MPASFADQWISGRVDFIVNNAATTTWYGPLLEVSHDAFAKTMIANTWRALSLVQHAVKAGMRDGAVVNISTTGAQRVHARRPARTPRARRRSRTSTPRWYRFQEKLPPTIAPGRVWHRADRWLIPPTAPRSRRPQLASGCPQQGTGRNVVARLCVDAAKRRIGVRRGD